MDSPRERDQTVEQLLRESFRTPPHGGVTDACLDAETLAAWTAGGLSGTALEAVQLHVADCSRCQDIAGTLARIGSAAPQAEPARTSYRWLAWFVPLTAAAAAIALWIAVPGNVARPPTSAELARVEEAAPREPAAPPAPAAAPAPETTAPAAPAAPTRAPLERRDERAKTEVPSQPAAAEAVTAAKEAESVGSLAKDKVEAARPATPPAAAAPAPQADAAPQPRAFAARSALSAANAVAPGDRVAGPRGQMADSRCGRSALVQWRIDMGGRRRWCEFRTHRRHGAVGDGVLACRSKRRGSAHNGRPHLASRAVSRDHRSVRRPDS